MSARVRLNDFGQDARQLLAGMDRHDISMLSIDATRERDRATQAGWPSDPEGAAQAVREVLLCKPTVAVEDGLDEIAQSLRLACLVLDRGEDLDRVDQEALHWLLGRAADIVMHEKAVNSEVRERLYHALGPRKV